MKIKNMYLVLSKKYSNSIKIIKKWIFWIALDEEAYFMAKTFHLKITKLDKETIKVWFPDTSKTKWLNIFKNNNLAYILINKVLDNYEIVDIQKWSYIKYNLEDYELTKDRILSLKKLDIEEKNEKNFLLKDKLEHIYLLTSELLLKLPKKERYYFRDKIEKVFMDLLFDVYSYMYNLWDRKILIGEIFKKSLILREYGRFLYKLWKIKNDTVFLDIWDKWTEVLKICKGIQNKYKGTIWD